MAGGRNYSVGTERALYTLSRGYCYAPKCPERVLRNIDGEWFSKVHIAHIVAHGSNGPRHDEHMPAPERKRFHNLLLLCEPHHKLVDNKANEKVYTVAVLHGWKKDREGENARLLEDVNEDDVQTMLIKAVTSAKKEMLAAIGALSDDQAEIKALLEGLVEESFNRPYLGSDDIRTLEHAARMLGPLESNSAALVRAASLLGPLETNAAMLAAAANELGSLELQITELSRAANRIGTIEDNAGMLMAAARNFDTDRLEELVNRFESWGRDAERIQQGSSNFGEFEELVDRLEITQAAIASADYGRSIDGGIFNDSFKKGIITGVATAAAIAIAVMIIVLTV